MKHSLCWLFLIIGMVNFTTTLWAQATSQQSYEQRLNKLAQYCDAMNEAEQYDSTEIAARKALSIIRPNDYLNQSLFKFYLGKVHDNSDSAIYFLEQSLHDAQLANAPYREITALSELSHHYNNVAGYESKRDTTKDKLESILDTLTNDTIINSIYRSLENYYNITGQHEKEMTYLIQSLRLSIKRLKTHSSTSTDTVSIGVNYMVIAEGYLSMGQFKKALQYAKDARVYLDQYKNGIAHFYKTMSIAYLGLEQNASMYQFADSLTQLAKRENKYAFWEPRIALDLTFSDYFLSQKQSDSALCYVQLALSRDPINMDPYLKASADLMYGEIMLKEKHFSKALSHLNDAAKIGIEMGLEQYVHILLGLAKCHAGLGNWQKAVQYYEQYTPIRDTLYQQAAQQSIADAEAKFQNELKEQQILNQQQQLAFATQQQLWLTIGIILALAIVALLMAFYRNKKRRADELAQLNAQLNEANQTKAKLFGILGHDLRAPISQVYQLLKLQQQNVGISAAVQAQLSDKVQQAAGALLETLEDLLLWSKSQLSAFSIHKTNIALRPIIDQVFDLLQLAVEEKNIHIQNNVSMDDYIYTDHQLLQIILRNLIQNAIQASPIEGTIEVTFSSDNKVLQIRNKGNAFTQADYLVAIAKNDSGKSTSGLGLKLVQELSDKLGLQLKFDNPDALTTIAIICF